MDSDQRHSWQNTQSWQKRQGQGRESEEEELDDFGGEKELAVGDGLFSAFNRCTLQNACCLALVRGHAYWPAFD